MSSSERWDARDEPARTVSPHRGDAVPLVLGGLVVETAQDGSVRTRFVGPDASYGRGIRGSRGLLPGKGLSRQTAKELQDAAASQGLPLRTYMQREHRESVRANLAARGLSAKGGA